jgi:hypothetical protein
VAYLKVISQYLDLHVTLQCIEESLIKFKYSNTSLIRTNWERTLVQISQGPNYRSATENMFTEVIKWTSRVILGNTTLF